MLKVTDINAFKSEKIIPLEECISITERLKQNNKTIGICHGDFDLLHPGHILHFEAAKKLCEHLIVSIKSDNFIPQRKGSGRPIYPEMLRAYAIAKLEPVDNVIISNYKTAIEIINILKPSFYIKGPDFINKKTPGITKEKEAIENVGGKMLFTTEPTLSTTSIIDYIQTEIERKKILLCIDRDGTLIKDTNFLGKNDSWKNEIEYNNDVINFLIYTQTRFNTTKIVVSNQLGVALNLFNCARVEEINQYLNKHLFGRGLKIDNWQYCPYADENYFRNHPEKRFNPVYIKKETKRKPNIEMLIDGLNSINKNISDFEKIVVIGDSEDDAKLAINLNAQYIDVNNKKYGDLIKEIDNL